MGGAGGGSPEQINVDKGREGVKKSDNFEDIICVCSLMSFGKVVGKKDNTCFGDYPIFIGFICTILGMCDLRFV